MILAILLVGLFGAWGGSVGHAATRLGLHFTQEELWCWRQRAGIDSQGTHGITCPVQYVSAGDVSTNSPGDWNRIVANAALASSTGRWTNGPTILVSATNCVSSDRFGIGLGNDPPQAAEDWAVRLRDAAFADLVNGVTTHHATVKAELLWQAGASWANWDDQTHWCTGTNGMFDTNPSFIITAWLTKLLFAYDYLGRAAFTSGELTTMDTWFWNAANYWRIDIDNGMDSIFPNRWSDSDAGGPACTTVGAGCSVTVPYTTGPTVQAPSAYNSNRRGSILRFTGLASLYLTDHGFTPSTSRTDDGGATLTTIKTSSHLFVKEFVRRTMYPDGSFAEMCRGFPGGIEDLGVAGYAAATLAQSLVIAEHYARNGDASLITYNTSAGICSATAGSTVGTISDGGSRDGENRDLKFGMQSIGKYYSDVYARYLGTVGNADHRLDGRDPRNSCTWCSVADVNLAFANVYYQDATFAAVYLRTAANTVAYATGGNLPSSPGTPPWMGENGIYPAVLFMFGDLEGTVGLGQGIDPYNLTAGGAVPIVSGGVVR